MVAYTWNPRVETRGSGVHGHPQLHGTLPQTNKCLKRLREVWGSWGCVRGYSDSWTESMYADGTTNSNWVALEYIAHLHFGWKMH